jgi:hypothetical protein
MSEETGTFEGWAFLELMGHRRLAGKITEATAAGVALLRLDVYCGDAPTPEVTQFYSAAAIYCVTPSTENLCRAFALQARPRPVAAYELPSPRADSDEGCEGDPDDVPPY